MYKVKVRLKAKARKEKHAKVELTTYFMNSLPLLRYSREAHNSRMAKELRLNRTGLVILGAVAVVVMILLLYMSRGGYVDEKVKISELIAASIHLAEQGGKKIRAVRKLDDAKIGQLSKGQTKEGKDEYVTMGDQKSHEIITSGLKAGWPNLRYQSEEADKKVQKVKPPPRSNREVMAVAKRDEEVPIDTITVWIDPLDATQEYTEGREDPTLLRFVTVMVCIAIEGKPIAGIIHQPFKKDTFGSDGVTKWAWVGHGVSRTIVADTEPTPADDSKVRVIFSRSHQGEVSSITKASFEGSKEVEEIVAAGSGFKALAVAQKQADVYFHTTAIKKWDICAGDALLNALGGKMTTREAKDIDYSFDGEAATTHGIVAALGEHYNEYIEKLKL